MRSFKRLKRIIVVLLMVLLVIGGVDGLNVPSVSAGAIQNSGSLTVSCSSTKVSLNDQITVTVNVELGQGEAYNVMDITLDYNPTYLQYVSSENKITSYSGTLTNTVSSTSSGSVTLSRSTGDSNNYITKANTDGTAFTATFKVIKIDTSSSNSLQALTTNTQASGNSDIKPPAASTRVYISCAHKNTSTSVTKAATCTKWGEEQTKCTECGSSTYKNIPKTGHTYGEWTVVKAATVDAEGLEERKCIAGDDTQSRSIAKLEAPSEKATTQQQTTEATEQTTEQSTEQKATEAAEQTTEQSTEQKTTEETAKAAEQTKQKTTEQASQSVETKTAENGVNTGDTMPVVLLSIICALAFVGILLVTRRKED